MDGVRKAEIDELLSDSPYAYVCELGRGATAEVFVVRQKFLRKNFALKLLRPHMVEETGHLERLSREARCLGGIESPHVVGIVDMGRAKDGMPYVVLDLLEGHSVSRELELRGRLPTEEAVTWAMQALLGLGAAHELGLIHRDVTPENLFLQKRNSRPRILKVMDFGLARVLPDLADPAIRGSDAVHTSTGTIVGSPVYASPEALRGERLTAATDIYGVGLVLFQMLTGMGPLELVGTSVPDPSKVVPSVPVALDRVVARATEAAVSERYRSAAEFLAELKPFTAKA